MSHGVARFAPIPNSMETVAIAAAGSQPVLSRRSHHERSAVPDLSGFRQPGRRRSGRRRPGPQRLPGARGHGHRYSDHDLYVVLADDAQTDFTRFTGHRTPELDLVIISLAEFRASPPAFERYALARATVVLDRLGRGIAQALTNAARLGAGEAFSPPRSGSTPTPPPPASLQQVPDVGTCPVSAPRLGHQRTAGHRGPHRANGQCSLATAPLRPGRGSSPASRAQRSTGRVGRGPRSHAPPMSGRRSPLRFPSWQCAGLSR
jgi:hypothetical protein